MIEVPCYNCGSGKHTFYASENGFFLVKCSGCGLLYVTPRPDENDISEANKCGMHRGEDVLQSTGKVEKYKLRFYCRMLRDLYGEEIQATSRTWLDVGCGYGELMLTLRRFSRGKVLVKGLEPNVKKQEYGAQHGLDITFFDFNTHHERYDCISMLNVYSHLPNPVEFVSGLKHCLKPQGELLLQTGDTAGLPPKEHYRPFILPDHLSFCSEAIVTGILKRCGFQIVCVRKYAPFPFSWRFMKVLKEAAKLVIPGRKSDLWKLRSQHRLSGKYCTNMYIRAKLTH